MKSSTAVSLIVLSILLCWTITTSAAPQLSTFNFTNLTPQSTGFAFDLQIGTKLWPSVWTDNVYRIDITLTDIEITSDNIYGVPITVTQSGDQVSDDILVVPSNYTAMTSTRTCSSSAPITISFNPVKFPRWRRPTSDYAETVLKGYFQGRIVNPATASYTVKVEWISKPGNFDSITKTLISPTLINTMSKDFSFKYTPSSDSWSRKFNFFKYTFTGVDPALWNYPDDQRRVDSFSITDLSPYATTDRVSKFSLVDQSKPAGCTFNGAPVKIFFSPWEATLNTLTVSVELFTEIQVGDFVFTCDNVGLYPQINNFETPPPYFARAHALAVKGKRYASDRWSDKK